MGSSCKWIKVFLLLTAFAASVNSFEDNDLYGFAYIHQTVDDLNKALRFYTEVMDGMLIPEFRVRRLQGDSHYYQMFQKEILDARNRRVDPESLGVPDIRSGGRHQVNWDFVLFDNALMWLIQFTDTSGQVFYRFDTAAGSSKTGYGHLAFWMDSDLVNPYQMLEEIYQGQLNISSEYAGFSTVDDVSSYTQRNNLFLSDVDKFISPENGGFRLAATRGTVGEKVELSIRRGIGNEDNFRDFCSVKAVHSAMLDPAKNQALTNRYKKPHVKTNGFLHVEITVPDIDQGIEFYTTLIGGKLSQRLAGLQFPPPFRNMLLQDDILTARQLNRDLDADFGYVDITLGNPDAGTMDISFINFDNFLLELYTFHPQNPEDRDSLRRTWSSPAYLNVMSPGFWLKETVNMSVFIPNLESAAQAKNWTLVKANRAVDVDTLGETVPDSDYSRSMTEGELNGFEYTFIKGPAGEQFSVAKFGGRAREVLRKRMKVYGAVSTAFPETNPYTWGGFNAACQQVAPTPPPPPPTTKQPSRGRGRWGRGGWGGRYNPHG